MAKEKEQEGAVTDALSVPKARVLAEVFAPNGKIRVELLPEGAGGSAEGGGVDLQPLEKRVAALEAKPEAEHVDLNPLSERVTALENAPKVADKSQEVTALQGEVSTLQGGISTLQGVVSEHATNIASNDRRITALESRPAPESVNLQPLNERVTALEGKANILGEDGKVKSDLLPDSCKNEHCEAQPLPSDVVRTADIEDVVRKSALFDTEHNMILPELIPEAEVAVKWLRGKGRPDKPETTEGAIVGDEEDCTRYLSTDGAGTGAWEWEKRGGVWHVVRGDTGWRKLTSGALADGSFILIRRNEVQVDVQFYNKGNWGLIKFKPFSQAEKLGNMFALTSIPEGFRGCMPVICPIYNDDTLVQIGGVNFNTAVSGGHEMRARFATNINKEAIPGVRFGLFNFPTVDAWPSSLPGETFEAICPTT